MCAWLRPRDSRPCGAMKLCCAGKRLQTNQYSVTEYDTPAHPEQLQLPSVWFAYDMSPVTVVMAQTRRSILHLLTRFCAVVGGVVAVTGGGPASSRIPYADVEPGFMYVP